MIVRVNRDPDVFKSFGEIQREMNRFFDPALSERSNKPDFENSYIVPRVDVFEKENTIYFEMDLPGIDKNDVKLNIEDNIMTLKGERKDRKEETGKYHICERKNGLFERSFVLPENVNIEEVKARFENGVLKVELPRLETRKRTSNINIQ